MLDMCLLTLICLADHSIVTIDCSSHNVGCLSTCARPVAMLFDACPSCAMAPTPARRISEVESQLNRWEQGSHARPACSRFLREEFRRLNDGVNEHTLTAAELLSGPITARALKDSYSWKIHSITSDQICLEGVPREEMETLFYSSIQVTFRMTESVPEQIVIVGRDPLQRTVWTCDRGAHHEVIALANFVDVESDIPPTPTIVRQTASRIYE